jgi:hypothetical protein
MKDILNLIHQSHFSLMQHITTQRKQFELDIQMLKSEVQTYQIKVDDLTL